MQSTEDKPLEFKMAEAVEGTGCKHAVSFGKLAQSAKLLNFTRELSVSNFGQDTDYSDCDLT
jgi:hypothetical protein